MKRKAVPQSIYDSCFVAHIVAPLLTALLLSASMLVFTITIASAQSLIQPPAPQSPHWSHINIFDFGRALYLGNPPASDIQWMTTHLDAIEVHGNVSQVRTYNPTIALSSYQFDMSIFQSYAEGLTDESWFLHHSQDTTLQFWTLDHRSLIKTITIPGCPTTPVVACRVQVYLWNDYRYIFNLNAAGLRSWLASRLLGSKNAYGMDVGNNAYVWLDEHAPGFQWPFSYGFQTLITSGGAVRELGNLTPSKDISAIGALYNPTVESWLAYLAPLAQAANKKVLINANAQVLNGDITSQLRSIQGFDTESYFRPDGSSSPSEFQSFINVVKTSVANGGWISLHGIWGHTGPAGYTAGNYSTSVARYNMWRVIAYYLLKEPVGSPGIVYFNPAFASNDPPFTIANDIAAWLPAYQVDVGQPITADSYTHQTGSVGGVAYTIFGRAYTKGLALVRPQNGTNYDDTSAATVSFATPVQVLKADGTLLTPTTSVTIRNAEAVYVFTSNLAGRVPPATPQNLRVR